MLKIFRKNKKWLLVVGGTFLLIVFLVQGTLSQFHPDPRDQVVATMGAASDAVTMGDFEHADMEYQALRDALPRVMIAQTGVASRDHWFLLVHEARRAGFVANARDGEDWLPEIARAETMLQLQADPVNAQRLVEQLGGFDKVVSMMESNIESTRQRARLSPVQFHEALAKLRGIRRMIMAYEMASRYSDRRAIIDAKHLVDSAMIDAVVIPASVALDQAPEPTPEQMQAQFEKYKNDAPGRGEHGFGYQLPPRVKLEWLTLDRAALSGAVKLDQVNVYRHWQTNRETFPGDFQGEQGKVQAVLRERQADELMSDIDRMLKGKVRAATRKLEADGSFKKLPADWESQRPRLVDLAGSIVEMTAQAGLEIPAPIVSMRTDAFVPLAELASIPGLGESQFQAGTIRGSFSQLIGALKELSPTPGIDAQAGIPLTNVAIQDRAGNRYLVTIVEAVPAGSPESIDQVREDVARDCRLLWAFDQIKAQADALSLKAVTDGLASIANEFARPAAGGGIPVPLEIARMRQLTRSRSDPRTPALDSQELRDAVLSRVASLDPRFTPSPDNAVLRSFAVAAPQTLSMVVAQIVGQRQMSKENVRMLDQQTLLSLRRDEYERAVPEPSGPFSEESLKQRLKFKMREIKRPTDIDPSQAPAG